MNLLSGFTEEEREFSQNAILRQQQANHTDTHEDIDEEDEEDLDDTGHGEKLETILEPETYRMSHNVRARIERRNILNLLNGKVQLHIVVRVCLIPCKCQNLLQYTTNNYCQCTANCGVTYPTVIWQDSELLIAVLRDTDGSNRNSSLSSAALTTAKLLSET